MGKKSGAKKKKRAEKVERAEASSPPKAAKKKKAEKLKSGLFKASMLNKKKVLGGAFVAIMIAILVSVGYLLFEKAFKAMPLAKLLPADSTVMILEMNSNTEHNQFRKSFQLLKNHPEYSQKKLISSLEQKFTMNFESDLRPWLGRQIGAALVKSKAEEGYLNVLYFAEVVSKKAAKDALMKHEGSINTYANQETYMTSGPYFATFLGDYLVLSDAEQAIYEAIDNFSDAEKLYTTSTYRKISNNLPINKAAFLYLNFDQITDSFFRYFQFLGEKGLSMENLGPFLELFDAEGIALIAMDNNFAMQNFLALDGELAKNIKYPTSIAKYNAKLTDYVLENSLAFWGGENLEAQLKRILEILAGGNESTLIVFDNLINSYTQKYFGPDINFNYDILPLFKNEFALAIEELGDEHVYKLLIELSDFEQDSLKLHEIASNFASQGAIFEPKIVEHTLEDGTVTKELVAVPEEIVKSESDYKGTAIFELKLGKQNWGIYYAIIDDIAVIATNTEGVKSTVDITENSKVSLGSTEKFTKHIFPVLSSSDEVSYFNLDALMPILFSDKDIPNFVEIIASLSSGRNYFNDGVVTINYINIK